MASGSERSPECGGAFVSEQWAYEGGFTLPCTGGLGECGAAFTSEQRAREDGFTLPRAGDLGECGAAFTSEQRAREGGFTPPQRAGGPGGGGAAPPRLNMDPRVTAALREVGIPYRENEPLSKHTSLGVGGPAAVMAFPRSPEELRRTLALRKELAAPHRILGGGSNLVVVDEGLDELVLNTRELRHVAVGADGVVDAEGGANLIRTVVRCCRAGLAGMQSAVGIPGSVGGAAVMNAGAYGFSISDVLREILVFDADGEAVLPPEGWRFHYRGSSIPEGSAVARISVALRPGDPAELGKQIRELQLERVRSQPGGRNAGCVFKNPPGAHAGRIIDELGLKGARRGRAVVSERHANFIVNEGGARAADVLELAELLRERVARETGVELEWEVKVWRRSA